MHSVYFSRSFSAADGLKPSTSRGGTSIRCCVTGLTVTSSIRFLTMNEPNPCMLMVSLSCQRRVISIASEAMVRAASCGVRPCLFASSVVKSLLVTVYGLISSSCLQLSLLRSRRGRSLPNLLCVRCRSCRYLTPVVRSCQSAPRGLPPASQTVCVQRSSPALRGR